MTARHPSRQRLQRWLETGASRRVSGHIERCARCQELLDELTELGDELVADLQAATDPPADIRERTHGGVDTRLRNEAAVGALMDLFTIGWDFTRSVLDPEITDGDEPHEPDPTADHSDGGPS